MKKYEWVIIIFIFLLGFIWGMIKSQSELFSLGSGLGAVVVSIPVSLIIFLLILTLRRIKLIRKSSKVKTGNTPRLFFVTYFFVGFIMMSLLILEETINFNLIRFVKYMIT